MSRRRRVLLGLASLALAAVVWIPCVHLVFGADPGVDQPGLSPFARSIAARHLDLWRDPALREKALADMQRTNMEWDLMARFFLVLSLANIALRDPSLADANLTAIDAIIEDTIRLERERGCEHFLMSYAKFSPFVRQPARSLFVDGEIALMIGARRVVREKEEWKRPFRERIDAILERQIGEVLSGESYPNECWTFDNANALAALRFSDALDGTDHRKERSAWIARARERLVSPKSGLLISSYSLEGWRIDGPEGSTIWMVAHALQLVDEGFAREQYETARAKLRRRILGFHVAKEWPDDEKGRPDVDSGLVVPGIQASPSSSGLALVAAAAFGDRDFLAGLFRSLEFAAFPMKEKGRLRYAASNGVGDAVILYASVQGPLWREVIRRNPW